MCKRFSWIEKNGQVLFLTPYDVFETKRGKQLQKHTPEAEDWHGHGAIRWFYRDLKGGIERECTDFSTPKHFPPELVKAIKAGQMWRFGITEEMLVILQKPARSEYEKVEQAARSEYDKVEQAARSEYDKVRQAAWSEYDKVRQAAWSECDKVRRAARSECDKVRRAARSECDKVRRAARSEYDKVRQAAWAELFQKKTNRIKAWQ